MSFVDIVIPNLDELVELLYQLYEGDGALLSGDEPCDPVQARLDSLGRQGEVPQLLLQLWN